MPSGKRAVWKMCCLENVLSGKRASGEYRKHFAGNMFSGEYNCLEKVLSGKCASGEYGCLENVLSNNNG